MPMPSMVYIPLFLYLITSQATCQSSNLNITLGSSLSPTNEPTAWFSPSRYFAFGFYPESNGFRIGVWLITPPKNNTIIWTANRDDDPIPSDASLKLTMDGLELILKNTEDKTISVIRGNAFSASMLDAGNFIISDENSRTIWQTSDSPTDTIISGQSLSTRNELVSSISQTNHSSGRFRIKMQNDGNLNMYPVRTLDDAEDSYWASGTNGPNANLYLNGKGMLYLMMNGKTSTIYTLTTNMSSLSTIVYRATIDVDGIFRLYSHDLTSSTTEILANFPDEAGQCKIKGFCGVNSYCISKDRNAECQCLPNFDYINDKVTYSGCIRNSSINECHKENGSRMQNISNIVWQNDFYDMSSTSTQEACQYACLEDCSCDVAIFDGQNKICYKQKLPLKYGYSADGETTITFIKIGNSTGQMGSNKRMPALTAKEFSTKYFSISIVATAFLLSMIFVLSFFLYRHRALRNRELDLVDGITLRSFSYNELKRATNSFKEELGKGAFGKVYKGVLSENGRIVAIKRLHKIIEEGEKEFRAEMKAIGNTHHKNLVRLIGFCDEGIHRLLVYEYMKNGSLANLIFNSETSPPWDDRKRIVIDIARGLNYLHDECETRIIHCDIKPKNILMDEKWKAKICDFGLAKLLMQSQTRTLTGIRGTIGYLAPEWHNNAPITVKADVYSFGIVLLETICCRKNIELGSEVDAIALLPWAYKCFLAGEVHKLVPDEVDITELNKFVKVGLWCTQSEPTSRPNMKNVIMMVEGNAEILPPPEPLFI